jgi:hypothetical protein
MDTVRIKAALVLVLGSALVWDACGVMLASGSPAIDNGENSICPAGRRRWRWGLRYGSRRVGGQGIPGLLALGPRRNRCIARPTSESEGSSASAVGYVWNTLVSALPVKGSGSGSSN